MSRNDLELLRDAREGDSVAMEELLARHEKQIFRFGMRMCGSEEDARDVLQETLVAAFQGLPEFRGDAELSTWLYRIARSHCSRARRLKVGEPARMGPLEAPEVRALPADAPAPDALAHARQVGDALQAAIRALPERHREVVVLKDVEGLSAEEVAEVLGEDVAAVKSRLHRARLELRRSLSELLGETPSADGAACPELAAVLATDERRDVDQATCARIEEHLTRCPRCKQSCAALERTVSICKRIPGDRVPPAVQSAVRHALLKLSPPRS